MSTNIIDEFTELRGIFPKYTFSRENDVVFVKFGDFTREYSENLSVEIHAAIDKYEKFSFSTVIENSIMFSFSTFNVTTNLIDYNMDFEYSKGDVENFDFIDFIIEYEKLFVGSQEIRDKFNNYDICITIDLQLMVKFRDMTSFDMNINKEIHDNIFKIIEYLTYYCVSCTDKRILAYEFENYKVIVDFDKIVIMPENKIVYSLDELKAIIDTVQETVEDIDETIETTNSNEFKPLEDISETKIIQEEVDFNKLLKKNTMDYNEICKQCNRDISTPRLLLRVFVHFAIIIIFAYTFNYLAF